LSYTALDDVDFRGADLRGANLRMTNPNSAKFDGAEIEGAIWSSGAICGPGSMGADCRVKVPSAAKP